jgi:hypothetical protein
MLVQHCMYRWNDSRVRKRRVYDTLGRPYWQGTISTAATRRYFGAINVYFQNYKQLAELQCAACSQSASDNLYTRTSSLLESDRLRNVTKAGRRELGDSQEN